MTLPLFLALALVAGMGFAAHRASLCTVRAVTEMMTSGTTYMLASFAKAVLWTVMMGLVAQASASKAAAGRGVTIPGNTVLMVFRNDFAVRMLQASVAAGFEAPLRIYVTENADNSSTVSYRTPSTVFAPYRNKELDALSKELDPIFERIVGDAASAQ